MSSSQKFLARNRAPRIKIPKVSIEYDVEKYGAVEKTHLPFVIGVMAGLSGKPVESASYKKEVPPQQRFSSSTP